MLVFADESGYAQATPAEFGASSTVTLKPWARVEGRLVLNGKPVPDTEISVGCGYGGSNVLLRYSAQGLTAADGTFAVELVAPVQQFIQPRFRFGEESYSPAWFSGNVDIKPGETTRVTLPRGGRPIVGRIALPPDSAGKLADLDLDVSISLRPPSVSGDQVWVQRAFKAYGEFMNSDYGRAYRQDKIAVGADGDFRIEGLPETAYVLHVTAYPKTDPRQTDLRIPVASYASRVEVPPLDEQGTIVDLGQIVMKMQKRD
jgi:hypothetical protein